MYNKRHRARSLPNFENKNTRIMQAWRVTVEGLEQYSSLLLESADALVDDCAGRLSSLITEKRASRKVYAEDHAKIVDRLSEVGKLFS